MRPSLQRDFMRFIQKSVYQSASTFISMNAICLLLLFAPAVVARLSNCGWVLAVRVCMRAGPDCRTFYLHYFVFS
jgi:hypothetical protein